MMFVDAILLFWMLLFLLVTEHKSNKLYWMFAFPGVFCHELTHLVVALITGGRPHNVNLIPVKSKEDRWIYGSVQFYPTWFNGSLVALAPFLLMGCAYYLFFEVLHAEGADVLFMERLPLLLAIAMLLKSGLPSKEDWAIAVKYPIPALVIAGVIWGALAWQ